MDEPRTTYRLGTVGFSYPEWDGVFYPSDLKSADRLAFYARFFDTVEIDTTFHGVPAAATVERWAATTPAGFQFCVKAPKTITHEAIGPGSTKLVEEFVAGLSRLGDKLAVVLLQFPPSFAVEQAGRLEAFLKALPRGSRYAVELRNRTWGRQETLDLLSRHNVCLVSAEYLSRPARIHATADLLFIRWIGEHGRYEALNREEFDPTPALQWWRDEISRQNCRTCYGFFNNDYAGYAVATCSRFRRMLGLPDPLPTRADLGQLFG